MKIKIASYNISGGFYPDYETVDFLDKTKSSDIDLRLLNDIIEIINNEKIDIICFQEIITTKRIDYINRIIEKTELKYEEHFELSPCDVVEDTECGLAILSKYPISSSVKKLFTNPMFSKTTSSGKTYYTFDKGLLFAKIKINNSFVSVLTNHGFPFRRFNEIPEDHKDIFVEFDGYIQELNPDIITGDFNSENFINMMPYTKNHYIRTINETTTDDGMKFDDILLKKGTDHFSEIIKSSSDHFAVIDEIDLKNKMETKFKDLIEKCKNKVPLNEKNVGDEMTLVDRGPFQLIIPPDNTDEHGDFFVYSTKGHDCYSYNDKSTHIYRIIDGTGDFIVDDKTIKVGPGDTVTIEPGQIFTYKGNLIMTFEMTPNFQEKNDHFVKRVDYNE